jgi:hypothetical protein
MTEPDFLSPFEELVLTAILEAGNGADEIQVWLKARHLSRRPALRLMRVQLTLGILERDGCLYSWFGDPTPMGGYKLEHYRVQLYGQRALDSAIRRRGSKSSDDYFHHASRFGWAWDVMLARTARKRAQRLRSEGFESATGPGPEM